MHPSMLASHSLSIDLTRKDTVSADQLFQAKKALRKSIRSQRNGISTFEQHNAAKKLLVQLKKHAWFNNASKIALYLANDGEVSCDVVSGYLTRLGKRVYLPVLHPINKRQLFFVQHDQHTPMRYNRFGIQEPQLKRSRIVRPEQVDLVLMPLVGFDSEGNRLGMGGGFYDTTFEKVVNQPWRSSPMRVGAAHDCQQVDQLPQEPWDIPLNAVITPSTCIKVAKA